jgi:uncharacterized protein YjdB
MNSAGRTRHSVVSRFLLASSLLVAGLWIDACGGGSDSLTPVQVGAVAIEPGTAQLASIGDTTRLTVKVTDTDGKPIAITDVTVTWTSSNPSVATVNSAGLVTAVSNGSATITASAEGISTNATVTVSQVMASLSVTPATATLVSFGETTQLVATPLDAKSHPILGQTAAWTSSDNGIASVSAVGLVTAVANGNATLTATLGNFTATAAITVAQVVASVSVTPATSTLASLGENVQLSATAKDANGNPVAAQAITWASSNTSVAMVGPTGLVTAMASGGPVTITASAAGEVGDGLDHRDPGDHLGDCHAWNGDAGLAR